MQLANYSFYELMFTVLLMYFGAFLDASLTAVILWKVTRRRPLEQVVDLEINPVGRKIFLSLGIVKGYFALLLLSFGMLSFLAWMPFAIWHYAMVVGMYVVVVFHNYSAYRQVVEIEKKSMISLNQYSNQVNQHRDYNQNHAQNYPQNYQGR